MPSEAIAACVYRGEALFACRQCGECCKGYGGTYVSRIDVDAISAYLGVDPAEKIIFKDHARYGDREERKIREVIASTGAQALVTTLKDKVKLDERDFSVPLFCLEVETEPAPSLLDLVFAKISSPV